MILDRSIVALPLSLDAQTHANPSHDQRGHI